MVVCCGEILELDFTAHTVHYGYCVDVTLGLGVKRLRVQDALLGKVVSAKAITDGSTSRTSDGHRSGHCVLFHIRNLRRGYGLSRGFTTTGLTARSAGLTATGVFATGRVGI